MISLTSQSIVVHLVLKFRHPISTDWPRWAQPLKMRKHPLQFVTRLVPRSCQDNLRFKLVFICKGQSNGAMLWLQRTPLLA